MKICVYCASSDQVDPKYFEFAGRFGKAVGEHGHEMIFGGGACGLMGAAARAAKEAGSPSLIGIYPDYFTHLAESLVDEHVVIPDLRTRKRLMEERADAFVALPGGLGTLDEIFDLLAPKSLKLHDKPLVLLSPDGFFDPLISFIEQLIERDFVHPDHRRLWMKTNDIAVALEYVEQHAESIN